MIPVVLETRKLLRCALFFAVVFCCAALLRLALPEEEKKTSAARAPSPSLAAPGRQPGKGAAGDDFFVEFRLQRDRVRSQQVELLREIAGSPAAGAETRDRAQRDLLEITEDMGKEAELERLVLARGFPEAVVLLQADAATIVVRAKELSPAESAGLRELAARVAGLKPEQVVVIPRP